jgi:heme A synthase
MIAPVTYAGRILATLIGLAVIWLAVTMAVSPSLIVPIPKHGEAPERVAFEPTLTTEIARYVAAGLLGFLGLTIAAAPWRRGKDAAPRE